MPTFPHGKGRLASILISAIIGPPMAGLFFGLQNILFVLISNPARFGADLVAMMFLAMLVSFKAGLAPALMAMLGGWAIFARRKSVPLWATLAATTAAVGIWLTVPSPRQPGGPADGWNFLAFFPPALASAAICWRLTRRWHSPSCRA